MSRFLVGLLAGVLAAVAMVSLGQWPSYTTRAGVSSPVAVAEGGTGLASGTSGGVLCYTATTTIASSGVLTSGRIPIGGGAGACPTDSANLTWVSPALSIGAAGVTGSLKILGSTSGTATMQTAAVAGTPTLTLPTATGTLALTVGTGLPAEYCVAASDETTAVTTGTAKVTFRMPYAMTLTGVRASVTTAPTGGTLLTIDINEAGATILSTKLTFDASEFTTQTAVTAAVISDSALADDAQMTVDFDAVGSTVAGAGVKVCLIGTRT